MGAIISIVDCTAPSLGENTTWMPSGRLTAGSSWVRISPFSHLLRYFSQIALACSRFMSPTMMTIALLGMM